MELLSVREAAELLRVNLQTIYRAIKRGELVGRRIGERGPYRFTLEDLHMGRGQVDDK